MLNLFGNNNYETMIINKIFNQFKYSIKDIQRWNCCSCKDIFYFIFEQSVWGAIFFRLSRAFFLINVPNNVAVFGVPAKVIKIGDC